MLFASYRSVYFYYYFSYVRKYVIQIVVMKKNNKYDLLQCCVGLNDL